MLKGTQCGRHLPCIPPLPHPPLPDTTSLHQFLPVLACVDGAGRSSSCSHTDCLSRQQPPTPTPAALCLPSHGWTVVLHVLTMHTSCIVSCRLIERSHSTCTHTHSRPAPSSVTPTYNMLCSQPAPRAKGISAGCHNRHRRGHYPTDTAC